MGNAAGDTYSCRLKRHDPPGEITPVTLSRDAVRITSSQNDAIRTPARAPPADEVPMLG